MANWFTKLFEPAPKCKCGGTLRAHRYGGYTRAYNAWCRQAAGATGAWCDSCRSVTFEEPDFDKWLAQQPDWIVPYGSKLERRSDAVLTLTMC